MTAAELTAILVASVGAILAGSAGLNLRQLLKRLDAIESLIGKLAEDMTDGTNGAWTRIARLETQVEGLAGSPYRPRMHTPPFRR